ncbi:FAD-dependent monooxygenase [Streptomyces sp. NPDC004610]|uniref:FAD-dependent monooxygenase n=1 Tax=unclassified Streptomyces TaxID=2593676 RepID=UPI0033AE5A6F
MSTSAPLDGEILVVGAGPTGLALACTLLQHGVECRIVDRRRGPASEPKALILWSGALEVLRRIGVDGPLRDRSLPLAGASYWSRGRPVGGVRFGALEGTAFPRPLCVPQSVTENVLYERLLRLGGQVEWNTEAIDARVVRAGHGSVAEVTLARQGAYERQDATPRWLIGADGAHSSIRTSTGIAFEGGSYARDFLLGDGEYDGDLPAEEVQYHLTPQGVLVVVPLPGGGHRIFFDRAPGPSTAAPDEADLQRLIDERGPAGWRLRRTWWRSTFRVHTKVASTFRKGNVFLAGDAAHCHSPAGGQGLNTGVQDGYDLAWKLAAVSRGADVRLLDSYEAERRPAALRALANSDRQTKLWMLRAGPRRVVRDLILQAATRSGALDRKLVPELAQIDPRLDGSPAVPGALTGGGAAIGPRAGRRLPDTDWQPVSGTKARTLHGYLAAGRHVLLVLTPGAPQGAAAELARSAARQARRSPAHAQTEVLLLGGRTPDGTPHTGDAPDPAGGTGSAPQDTRSTPAPPAPGEDADRPATPATDAPRDPADPLSYAVAVERDGAGLTAWARTAPLVVYVRPDGVTAAWAGPDGLPELIRRGLSGAGTFADAETTDGTGAQPAPGERSAA